MNAKEFANHELLKLSLQIKELILQTLHRFPPQRRLPVPGAELRHEARLEQHVYQDLVDFFMASQLPVVAYMKHRPPIRNQGSSEISILIDPVNGMLNRELGVGDPAVTIAFARGALPTFGDVFGGYVFGLHSGEAYFSDGGQAYYLGRGSRQLLPAQCDRSVQRLRDAILYFNDGHGGDSYRHALRKAGALPFFVRHRNAFDNTAMEICQMSRGAAHVRVEARSFEANGRWVGSDHANLLPAFAIGRTAGLLITDLQGRSLAPLTIVLDRTQDFVCCSHELLLQETLAVLAYNEHILREMAAWPAPASRRTAPPQSFRHEISRVNGNE